MYKWNDKNLPVYLIPKRKPFTAEEANEICERALEVERDDRPDWRNDPTYNLKAKRS